MSPADLLYLFLSRLNFGKAEDYSFSLLSSPLISHYAEDHFSTLAGVLLHILFGATSKYFGETS